MDSNVKNILARSEREARIALDKARRPALNDAPRPSGRNWVDPNKLARWDAWSAALKRC